MPAGRILFHRVGSDGVEHYFTVNTDGTAEQALFTRKVVAARIGRRTEARPDAGRHRARHLLIHDVPSRWNRPSGPRNSIETLNLAPGATSADGRWVAFNGWDETDPSNTGLYRASPDLANLRQVLPLPEGALAVEPFGITPDGSQIVFFADTGPEVVPTPATTSS